MVLEYSIHTSSDKLGYHLQGANTLRAYTGKYDGRAVTGHSDSVHIPTMRKVLRQCEVPNDHGKGQGRHCGACACRRVQLRQIHLMVPSIRI
jgi:hypothetical protein